MPGGCIFGRADSLHLGCCLVHNLGLPGAKKREGFFAGQVYLVAVPLNESIPGTVGRKSNSHSYACCRYLTGATPASSKLPSQRMNARKPT